MSIRMALESDLPQMLDVYAPYVQNTAYSFEYSVPTPEEFTHRFRSITAQFPWLVWEENGQVLGYAYGSLPFERAAYQWCAELSIYLHPDVRGNGIGRKLYRVAEHILTLQGYKRVYAIITTENESSVAFHSAVGYTHVARFPDCGFKFGKWSGTVWMEKVLNSWEIPSNSPVPASVIVKTDRNFQEILDILSLS